MIYQGLERRSGKERRNECLRPKPYDVYTIQDERRQQYDRRGQKPRKSALEIAEFIAQFFMKSEWMAEEIIIIAHQIKDFTD